MKAVVQRVKSAGVTVDGQQIASIKEGLLCLIGIKATDTEKDCEFILRRILNTRIFPNPSNDRPWDLNVMQKEYSVLLVSQFTLCGIMKGNKPDYHHAMPPEQARPFYADFVSQAKRQYTEDRIQSGQFGAMMDVDLVNDGPVTLIFDSN